jgi:site-specific DNA-methyltransferase (cytosine-N4-specific)
MRPPGLGVSQSLETVQWDFAENPTRDSIHDLHSYPARFIPQIPRELIRLFHPGDQSAVLDPFCGCGTTLVEAVGAGIPAVGLDLNPLAVLISKVKTTPLSAPLVPLAQAVVQGRHDHLIEIPKIPRLDHWFKPPIQRALAVLASGIKSIPDPISKDALRVAMSRIVVRVSNQDSDTRYAAIEKNVGEEDVYELFLKAALIVESAIDQTYGGLFTSVPRVEVRHENVLTLTASSLSQPIGLVVTSPPYPNAYEYWLYHKYRMYWLGMDPIALRSNEIGARPHYFKKNPQTEIHFEQQMTSVFRLLSGLLDRGRFACFVVGRSIIHGRLINNVELLTRAAESSGFALAGTVTRTIARNRKSFNLSHAGITEETIAVFELRRSTK